MSLCSTVNEDSGFSSERLNLYDSPADPTPEIQEDPESSGSNPSNDSFSPLSRSSLSSSQESVPLMKNTLEPKEDFRKHSSPTRLSPVMRRRMAKMVPAPLAKAEEVSIETRKEPSEAIAALSSPPNTPRKLSYLKFRMKLPKPPPMKLMKKKLSCPSLTTYNNFFSNTGSPIRRSPPAVAAGGGWIRNNIEASLHCQEDPGPSRDSPEAEKRNETHATKSESCPSFTLSPPPGVRFKLVKEGTIQVCRLHHPRTVIGKLSSSKLLRRWENHHLLFKEEYLLSSTPIGFMERPVFYADIEDIQIMPNFDSSERFCLRVFVPEGSVLLQRNFLRYRRVLEVTDRPEVVLKEAKSLVELTKNSALQDEAVFLDAVTLVCAVINQIYNDKLPRTLLDPLINCVSPLLETVSAVAEICPYFTNYCRESPRSRVIDEVFINVAHQTLKKNMDFGKYPSARSFVQQVLMAVSEKNNGLQRIRAFIDSAHGPASGCPHPRILPNLVSASLAAIHSVFDSEDPSPTASPSDSHRAESRPDQFSAPRTLDDPLLPEEKLLKLETFCVALEAMMEYDDWRLSLSSILQPLPFPESTFANRTFARYFHRMIRRMGEDPRCEVHLMVLGVRDGKEGWFHMFCPGGPLCCDDGELFSLLLERLIHCCCKRKGFLSSITCMLGPLQLLALRENETAMEVLCFMLEMETVQGEDLKVQMITALQSTSEGKRQYAQLCDRQIALKELQQKGGPRKLTLPSKSTDGDLAVLLSSGSFGNLEWLSLAFTNVTSRCAEYLIKLPSLRYLNLWSTQFGDPGVQLISEHLPKLQVLNLCETPATDKGLITLTGLHNLRKLNLNSTQLSAKTFAIIKEKLPALQEVDIRYTEAWCADEYMP